MHNVAVQGESRNRAPPLPTHNHILRVDPTRFGYRTGLLHRKNANQKDQVAQKRNRTKAEFVKATGYVAWHPTTETRNRVQFPTHSIHLTIGDTEKEILTIRKEPIRVAHRQNSQSGVVGSFRAFIDRHWPPSLGELQIHHMDITVLHDYSRFVKMEGYAIRLASPPVLSQSSDLSLPPGSDILLRLRQSATRPLSNSSRFYDASYLDRHSINS